LTAGAIDRNINITISVYVSAQRFKRMLFSFAIAGRMDVFECKNKRYRKQLTKLSGNKVLRSRPRTAMFAVSFASFKSGDPSRDRVTPRAEVRVRNITVLSHLKSKGNTYSVFLNSSSVCTVYDVNEGKGFW